VLFLKSLQCRILHIFAAVIRQPAKHIGKSLRVSQPSGAAVKLGKRSEVKRHEGWIQ